MGQEYKVHTMSVQMTVAPTTVTTVLDPKSYDKGYDAGNEAGIAEGYGKGYTEGETAGHTAGYGEGREVGKAEGYTEGKTDGHKEGYEEGHTAGHAAGYETGKTDGYAEGETAGRAAGYEEGHEAGYTEGNEAGQQSEYDRFWDSFQENGTRTNYRGAFGGGSWKATTFNPKYIITPKSAPYAFMYFNYSYPMLDYRDYAHLFDWSSLSGSCVYIFQDAWMDYIELDASEVTSLGGAFGEGTNPGHKTHITLKVSEKCTSFSSFCSYCSVLTDLIFTDDSIIAVSISLKDSPLNKTSITSVVNALSATATGKTATFKQTAIDAAFTTEEWETLKATKPNWAFAYA